MSLPLPRYTMTRALPVTRAPRVARAVRGVSCASLLLLSLGACSGEADSDAETQQALDPAPGAPADADERERGQSEAEAPGDDVATPGDGAMPPAGSGPMGGDVGEDAADDEDGSAAAGDEDGSGPAALARDVVDRPFCTAVADWEPEWAALEREVLVLVNQVRAEGATCGDQALPPAPPLEMEPALRCAARVHTLDMVEREFFDHENPDGEDPTARIVVGAGYEGRAWGENIAGGSADAEGVMQQWMDSPGHCENILRASYRFIGVGYRPGGLYRHTWTQAFGG